MSQDVTQQITETYEVQAEPFRSICFKLRELIHQADPEIVEEWKWGPSYTHGGLVCNVNSFKDHTTINFFKGVLMKDPKHIFREDDNQKSRRIDFTELDQIDNETIIAYVKEAVELNKSGAKVEVKKREIVVPDDLQKLLDKSPKAQETFNAFPPSHKWEYIEWIEAAKREETRQARLQKAIEMMEEGKGLNDKYR